MFSHVHYGLHGLSLTSRLRHLRHRHRERRLLRASDVSVERGACSELATRAWRTPMLLHWSRDTDCTEQIKSANARVIHTDTHTRVMKKLKSQQSQLFVPGPACCRNALQHGLEPETSVWPGRYPSSPGYLHNRALPQRRLTSQGRGEEKTGRQAETERRGKERRE